MDKIDAAPAAEPAGEPSGAPASEHIPAGDNPQAPAAAGAGPNAFHALIESWWNEHFPGSAIARDTATWNVAHRAKEALKRLLAAKQES